MASQKISTKSLETSSPILSRRAFWLPALLAALLAAMLVSTGCFELGPAAFLNARDSEIRESTQAIQAAHDDAQRAKAYSSRGVAYSEKARYSRITKLIPFEEYQRLFDLAIKDHDQAVRLNPASSEVYFNRAQANYDRGSLDLVENKDGRSWFDVAESDFEKSIEKDPKNDVAMDRLGLAYEQGGQPDKAIRAYTQELALNSLGKQRLADAYCNIGFHHQQDKDLAAAAASYRKSAEFGVADDKSCPYDPFGNAVAIYTNETHEYDKAWEMVHLALKAHHLIAPELMASLIKNSGRSD